MNRKATASPTLLSIIEAISPQPTSPKRADIYTRSREVVRGAGFLSTEQYLRAKIRAFRRRSLH
ncbi:MULTISPECIES: hypothetical protein [Acidithiobacillus]|uniref:hypothetical protein n=1 Tax=Acidithiobacillus ferrivorans TaxID=160808 RepID=UPI001C07D7BB|nr:hypothetical protein [Acidithiobacillus ferrivorans]MBU2850725.1 hypothetical protein [Acidithiobacillus ferrivorans]